MFLRNDKLEIEDTLDRDGEICITIDVYLSESGNVWINEDEARQIVEHLTKVFNLKGTTP